MRRWCRDRLRRRVSARREAERLFVIVDHSMFRSEWRFFAVRGIDEARAKCLQWVRRHPCGQASVCHAPHFREYWRKYWKTCMNADFTTLDAMREACVRL